MQSFAKAAANPKPAQNASKNVRAADEDEPIMQPLSDDGEDEDSEMVPPPSKPSADQELGRQSRKEREAALRRMMEEGDEEPDKEDTPVDSPVEDASEPDPEPEPAPEEREPAEVVSSTGDGRRRGRRRVMKKKQITDENGYLGTFQTYLLYSGVVLTLSCTSNDPRSRMGVVL